MGSDAKVAELGERLTLALRTLKQATDAIARLEVRVKALEAVAGTPKQQPPPLR